MMSRLSFKLFKSFSFYFFTTVLLVLVQSLALGAEDTTVTSTSITGSLFTIAPNDQSVTMLMRIFGEVGGILPGTYQLIGHLFTYLNAVVLTVTVSAPTLFLVVRGILETSTSGEFLGRKMNKMWTPLRAVSGVGLLIPTTSGYSIIQCLVMWLILQGVGAADVVWNAGLDFVRNNGVFGGSSTTVNFTSSSSDNSDAAVVSYNLFSGLYCMQYSYYQSQATSSDTSSTTSSAETSAPTLIPTIAQDTTYPDYVKVDFDNPTAASLSSGSTSASDSSNSSAPTISTTYSCGSLYIYNPASDASDRNTAIYNAVVTSINSLATTAKDLVYVTDLETTLKTMTGYNNPVILTTLYLNNAAIAASIDQSGDDLSDASDTYKDFSANGWAWAGADYYQMLVGKSSSSKLDDQSLVAKTSSTPSTASNTDVYNNVCTDPTLSSITGTTSASADDYQTTSCNSIKTLYDNTIDTDLGAADESGLSKIEKLPGPAAINREFFGGGHAEAASRITSMAPSYDIISLIIWPPLTKGLIKSLRAFSDAGSSKSPLQSAVQCGRSILSNLQITVSTLGLLVQVSLLLTAGAGAIPAFGQGVGPWFAAAAMWFAWLFTLFSEIMLPLIISAFGSLYLIGFMLADYLPLMPFIIFFMGVAGWVLGVIECMMAAPIAALGLTYSEGQHEVFGAARPAIDFLVSIFLMPVLIILAFFLSMFAMDALAYLLNETFSYAMMHSVFQNIHGHSATAHDIKSNLGATFHANWKTHSRGDKWIESGYTLLDAIVLMAIYTAMMVGIVHKCLNLMHYLPSNILRHLGVHGNFQDYLQGGEQGVREIAQQAGQKTGESASGMASSPREKAMGTLQSYRQAEEKGGFFGEKKKN